MVKKPVIQKLTSKNFECGISLHGRYEYLLGTYDLEESELEDALFRTYDFGQGFVMFKLTRICGGIGLESKIFWTNGLKDTLNTSKVNTNEHVLTIIDRLMRHLRGVWGEEGKGRADGGMVHPLWEV